MSKVSKVETLKEGLGVSYGLSLAGGIIIVIGAIISWIWHTSFLPRWGWMMGGQEFMTMMVGASIIGIVSGALIIFGALMMRRSPHERQNWGLLVLILSVISFFGMGVFIGSVLGIIGGILALSRH